MRNTWLFAVSLVFVVIAIFSFTENEILPGSIQMDRKNLVLRNIGHELLLASGNKTSRVLPIDQVEEDVYHIRFESQFFIFPDTLISISRRNLATDFFPADYVVNVLNCEAAEEIVYGFMILDNAPADPLACSGRLLPEGCYIVEIKFTGTITNTAGAGWTGPTSLLLASMAFLLGLWRTRQWKKLSAIDAPIPKIPSTEIPIGAQTLFPKEQYALIQGEKVQLTDKETRLLEILAAHPNQVMERAELQEQIWGDGGMMVSRSLDVFISKLRKKIKAAEELEIVNIRGKGWILKIN